MNDQHHTPAPATHSDKDVSSGDSLVLGIGFAWELGYTIAIPAVLFGLGGGYLDRTFGASPFFLLIGLFLAFVISFAIIAQKVRMIIRRMPKIQPKKKIEPVHTEADLEQQAVHELFRPRKP